MLECEACGDTADVHWWKRGDKEGIHCKDCQLELTEGVIPMVTDSHLKPPFCGSPPHIRQVAGKIALEAYA